MTRLKSWLIFGAALKPLLFFAMEQEGDIESPPVLAQQEQQEEKPYFSFEQHAKQIKAFMWRVPEMNDAMTNSLTEVPFKEWMKVAYACDQKDTLAFNEFMKNIKNQELESKIKAQLATSFLGKMVVYREKRSDIHKENEKTFESQKKAANWRTVFVAALGALGTILGPVMSHYFPSGCETVVDPVVNGTMAMIGSVL